MRSASPWPIWVTSWPHSPRASSASTVVCCQVSCWPRSGNGGHCGTVRGSPRRDSFIPAERGGEEPDGDSDVGVQVGITVAADRGAPVAVDRGQVLVEVPAPPARGTVIDDTPAEPMPLQRSHRGLGGGTRTRRGCLSAAPTYKWSKNASAIPVSPPPSNTCTACPP